ncbi:hypothetical protein P6B95_15485 [Streptomyces atratus]|uniref:hypothetical protein n=1 Tax=Streptomyces atratus TaxID=1893 RepID=UPI00166F6CF8|nr:hypothetical protein [Streptomyces atratus]WPW28650.1 hypothetical protein P6B95_15485 [Streptomyces atratus]GGT74547.1 hypothetical protein GCM10010207_84940 [Streptomyces atratus]
MRRIVAALVPAVALTAALAPAAHAAPKPVTSPYTQASAMVNENGDLLEAKNIVSVTKFSTGAFCVKVSDDIDVAKSTVLTTPYWAGTVVARKGPYATCNNDPQSIAVFVLDTSGQYINRGFTLAVL